MIIHLRHIKYHIWMHSRISHTHSHMHTHAHTTQIHTLATCTCTRTYTYTPIILVLTTDEHPHVHAVSCNFFGQLFAPQLSSSGKSVMPDEVFAFDRTASRLIEMAGREYLTQCWRPSGPEFLVQVRIPNLPFSSFLFTSNNACCVCLCRE